MVYDVRGLVEGGAQGLGGAWGIGGGCAVESRGSQCVCGVVWCGVVWCGLVWYGVVWWCDVVWWCGVVWCGVAWWCGVVLCGVGMVKLDLLTLLSDILFILLSFFYFF